MKKNLLLAGKTPVMALVLALGLAAPAMAEVQIGARFGKTWLKVDGDRLTSGLGVDTSMAYFGGLLAYRWDSGAYLELGTGTHFDFPIFGFNSLDHSWLGGGWQFIAAEQWRITPKAGLVYSELETEDNIFSGNAATDRFHDVVPFAEIAVERRLGRHFGLGLFVRENFEDFGSSRQWGLTLTWAIPR